MRLRLLPREEKFYELFIEVARRTRDAAVLLRELFTATPERAKDCTDQITRLENEADELTRGVVHRLDRSFITPIDREDIHLLASDLDDVMDRIDGTARRADLPRGRHARGRAHCRDRDARAVTRRAPGSYQWRTA